MNPIESAQQPFLLVGLGNPGKAHTRNRHNVGFMFIDALADNLKVQVTRKRANALSGDTEVLGKRLILAKPQTFMNETGRSVAKFVKKHRIPLEQVLVVFDDLDLPLGVLRMRPHGGSSGHRGMKSILQHLGSQEFPRIRFGIGRPPGRMDPAEYVLKDFSASEMGVVQESLSRAADCFVLFLQGDLEKAMTSCNSPKDPE